MKKTILRRTSAVMLTVVLMFTAVFSVSMSVSAASTFTPRTVAPATTNKYYHNGSYNIFTAAGYGMPNCTCYAYGRAYEITGKKPNLCPYNAEDWYGYNKSNGYYSYGKTPKVGAIACWSYDGGGGHVAVVEKISGGVITFSNSAWGGDYFYLTTASTTDSNAGGSSWWNFQGYIYVYNGSNTEPDPVVEYKTGTYKTTDAVNMRTGAGTSYTTVTTIPSGKSLNVTSITSAGGYHWGKTTYNGNTGYVALEYCSFVSSTPTPTPTPTLKTGTYKTTDAVNMRTGAGTSYSVVTTIPSGKTLNVTSITTAGGYTWGKTTYNGNTGYVALEYCSFVSSTPTPTPSSKTGYYKVNDSVGVNMRSGAGTNYSLVVSVPYGTQLKVTSVTTAGGYTWGKTTYGSYSGYVALDFCEYVSAL